MEIPTTPETKSAPSDVAAAFEEFQRGFESYKQGNNERVGKLERRSDPLVEQKVARIGDTLDAQKLVLDELVLRFWRMADRGRLPMGDTQDGCAQRCFGIL